MSLAAVIRATGAAHLQLVSLLLAGLIVAPAAARPVTDSVGRTVEVPDRIWRVLPVGPPASVIVYMLAPDKLLGWTRAISPPERPFFPAQYADLPELGRLTGRGNTINLELVVQRRP